MANFLYQADRLKRERDKGVVDALDAFEDVSSARTQLRGIYENSQLDLNNIEVLFSTIEMGLLIGKFPGRDVNGIEQLRSSLITLIFKTLEATMLFPVADRHVYPPVSYRRFARLLKDAKENGNWPDYSSCAVITFNYDIALDYALHHDGIPFDYCVAQKSVIGSLPLLKLHGSINWGVCKICKSINPYEPKSAKIPHLWEENETIRYNLGSLLPTRQHCEQPLSSEPLLVPPTWDKTTYHTQLGQVWREACKQLEQAENIFVMGYLCPRQTISLSIFSPLGQREPRQKSGVFGSSTLILG